MALDKLDLLLELNKQQNINITEVKQDIKSLEKKVDNYAISTEQRLTSVESTVRLRSRIGGAIVALLPAVAVAIYFLLQFFSREQL